MDGLVKIVKSVCSRVPFKVFTIGVYVVSLLWIPLWLLALPLVYLYQSVLCVIAWSVMAKEGKDVIAISDVNTDYTPWTTDIAPLIQKRAWFLFYNQRESWDRWSLAVRLFHAFGPAPKTALFLPRYLPTVIVVRRFRFPVHFNFGPLARDKEANLENLRSSLVDGPR
jgi:hypothetical protein